MPNITGRIGGDEFPNAGIMGPIEGAFYYAGTWGDTYAGGGWSSVLIGFDASRLYSGQMYRKNCNAVSVNSYGVYMWIRTN